MAEPAPIAVTLGDVMDKYEKEYLPELSKATRQTDTSMFNSTIRPKWKDTPINVIQPEEVQAWIKTLALAPLTRKRVKRLMKSLFDQAMFWKLLPIDVNPMTLVKVRGGTRRQKKIVILSFQQVNLLIQNLRFPFNEVALVAAILGVRVEEALALQWGDLDFGGKTVHIQRAFSRGEIKDVKSEASNRILPLADSLSLVLLPRKGSPDAWLFPSPRTPRPYTPGVALTKILKPTAEKLGLPNIGWHTFRHSYKAWIASGTATLTQQKDLMGQASIEIGLMYGGTPVEEMRPLNEAVASRLRPNLKPLPASTY
jgi:integrase